MGKENGLFIDYKEWELLASELLIRQVKPTDEINADVQSIKISRDNSYKMKVELEGNINGLSDVRKESGLSGEIVEGFVLEGTAHHGMTRYLLADCYLGDVNISSNIYERGNTFKGNLTSFKVNEIYSQNETDVLFDWFLNGPRGDFIFSRTTSRVEKRVVNKYRMGIDSEDNSSPNLESASSRRDYAFIDIGDIKFIVSLVPNHYPPEWSEKIAIEYRKEWGIPNEEVRNAISELVGFILGKQLLQVGTTRIDGNGYVIERNAISPWGENVVSACQNPDNNPVSFSYERFGMFEGVLNQLLPRYLELRDQLDLSNALWKYWIAENMPIGTNLPVLAAAIEGLAKNWFKSKMSKTKGVYMESKAFKNLLSAEIESIKQKMSQIENGQKIINKINSSYNMGANDRLNYFFEELNITVGEAERAALKARNAMAHGDASSSQETVQLVKMTRIYQTFFHRVILKLLGYEGSYIDRGTVGFPERSIDEQSGEI
ncbi:HEPN domain-containing protein [Bacillus cereus group sp. BfR-BA-01491]|uniref:HEPN domain-containing protein n=1 Tax=Bacillus cereus group sp. BfR-BA-01491 TaxID=2920360 RepID=UPI001F5AED60|nr:HEPN domain-containing protein [Bacillus cereus group sp. BfR-BA-01491]